jgi:hypothetical protein
VPGLDDPGLPRVVLVSAPGWSRSYEGRDWIPALEADLAQRQAPCRPAETSTTGPAPLGVD